VPIIAKGVTKTARDKQEKKEPKENLHRNISQADSTMPRIKDRTLHYEQLSPSSWRTFHQGKIFALYNHWLC
jgi:hypothetical protein